LTGVAVKVTAPPSQTGFGLAEMKTLTGRGSFTVIRIVFEVTGLALTQVKEEVITTDTWSPFWGMQE
jgi:hypothetical protein